MAFESEKDVARHLPRFIDSYNERRLHSAAVFVPRLQPGKEPAALTLCPSSASSMASCRIAAPSEQAR